MLFSPLTTQWSSCCGVLSHAHTPSLLSLPSPSSSRPKKGHSCCVARNIKHFGTFLSVLHHWPRVCGEPAKNNRCGATPSMPLQTIPTCLGEHVVGKRKIESCGVTFRTRNVRSRLPDQHTFLAYRQVSVIKSFVSSAKFWCLKHLRPTCHAENRRLM